MSGPVGHSRRVHHPLASLCASAWLMLVSLPGATQPAVELAALERCASIATDAARLTCYDALTDVARGTSEPAQVPAAPPREATESSATPSAGIDAFGVEQVEDRGFEVPVEIQSRIVGPFTGWRGNTVFRLENGQVWRQSEQDRLVFEAEAPLVTIRRGAFGTYRLSVEGVNSSVRVRRVE